MNDLHNAIIDLPDQINPDADRLDPWIRGYHFGHRDARHAAAELASEYAASHQRLKEALEKVSFALSATPDDPGEPSFMPAVREALRSAP